jgi:glutamate synthase (NADPH/NADH) large chain
LNGLRSRVRVQVDGQLKTGRDVAFAALLGADEFGFATAPLVASGCVMMRKCHLNTCPVGIATQDPELRARFAGTPEHVVRYFFFVAEELRAIMAQLGFRALSEMVGRADCIRPRETAHPKAKHLDFSRVLHVEKAKEEQEGRKTESPDEEERPDPSSLGALASWRPGDPPFPASSLDESLLDAARLSLKFGEPTAMQVHVSNADRAFGARLAGEIARRYGADGLRDETITIEVKGTAGQSFGAFAVSGMLLVLEGDANDYVGKGLSGGVVALRPPARAAFRASDTVIAGNTCLYGATSGRLYMAGRAGERFAVRNSGAVALVEGVGDHGCEYMTGGTVVVLGWTGRNFAAGMSGGVAYALDDDARFASRCNRGTVEIEPLTPEDEDFVRSLVEEHVLHTRSEKGRHVLASWGRHRFVKVLPTEYKRVLGVRASAENAPSKAVGDG